MRLLAIALGLVMISCKKNIQNCFTGCANCTQQELKICKNAIYNLFSNVEISTVEFNEKESIRIKLSLKVPEFVKNIAWPDSQTIHWPNEHPTNENKMIYIEWNKQEQFIAMNIDLEDIQAINAEQKPLLPNQTEIPIQLEPSDNKAIHLKLNERLDFYFQYSQSVSFLGLTFLVEDQNLKQNSLEKNLSDLLDFAHTILSIFTRHPLETPESKNNLFFTTQIKNHYMDKLSQGKNELHNILITYGAFFQENSPLKGVGLFIDLYPLFKKDQVKKLQKLDLHPYSSNGNTLFKKNY